MARKTLIGCLGEEVRHRRKALGFSQIALALEAEISPNAVGRLKRGDYNPTVSLLESLVKPLRVALSELLAGAERRCGT